MPTGMGVTDPKFAKGGRKLKKTKHYTIPPNLEKMKSEKASRIRKICHLLEMDNDNRKRHYNEKYSERCKNLMGRLETYNQEKSRMHQEGKSVSCQGSVGKIEPKMSNYLPHYPSHTLQA